MTKQRPPSTTRSPFDWMRAEMENMMGELSRRFGGERGTGGQDRWFDADVDVSETEQEMRFDIDMPGVDLQDVELSVSDNVLTVRAHRHYEEERQDRYYRVSERRQGFYERSFTLPPNLNSQQAHAFMDKGVLSVLIPKSREAQSHLRRIPIERAPAGQNQPPPVPKPQQQPQGQGREGPLHQPSPGQPPPGPGGAPPHPGPFTRQ